MSNLRKLRIIEILQYLKINKNLRPIFLPGNDKSGYRKQRQNKVDHLTMVSFDKLKDWHELDLSIHQHGRFWGNRLGLDTDVFARCFEFFLPNVLTNILPFDFLQQHRLLVDGWSNLCCSKNGNKKMLNPESIYYHIKSRHTNLSAVIFSF